MKLRKNYPQSFGQIAKKERKKALRALHLWDDIILKQKVSKIIGRLSSQHIEDAVKRVQDWRDKAAAHQDLTVPKENMPSIYDLKLLTEVGTETFIEIQAGFDLGGTSNLHVYGSEPDNLMYLVGLGQKYVELQRKFAQQNIDLTQL